MTDPTRHEATYTLTSVPERFARIYRRRGMEIPTAHSGHDEGSLVPYERREWHEQYARAFGYFWLPCVLCSQPYGGHEIVDTIPDPTRGPRAGLTICPTCTAQRNGGEP